MASNLAPYEHSLCLETGDGTNTRVRVVAAGDHGHIEEDLRYVRRVSILWKPSAMRSEQAVIAVKVTLTLSSASPEAGQGSAVNPPEGW
jgi:hypothetical protein